MGDVLLKSPLVGAGLPSPSVLTGNFRPQTAAAFVEQTLAEAKARAACGSRLGTPALSQSASQPHPMAKSSAEEVSALRSMASKHLGHLRQTPPSPYVPQHPPLPSRCLSTPPLRPHPAATPPRTPAPPPLTPPQAPSTQPSSVFAPPQLSPPPAPPPPLLEPSTRELLPAAAAGGGGVALLPRAGAMQQPPAVRFGGSSGGGATAAAGIAPGPESPTSMSTVTVVTAGGAAGLLNIEGLHPQGITAVSCHPLFASHVPAPQPALPRLVIPPPDEPSPAASAQRSPSPPPATPPAPPAPLVPSGPANGGGPSVAWASGVADAPSGGGVIAASGPYGGRVSQQPLSSSGAPPQRIPYTPYPHPHTHPQVMSRLYSHASAQSSRPSTGLSIQDLSLPRPTARMAGSRSPTRGSVTQLLDLSRSGSASGVGGSASMLDAARQSSPAALTQYPGGAGLADTARSSTGGAGSSSSVASPSRGTTRFQHTVTRWASEAAAAAAAAGPGCHSEGVPAHRPGGLRVTRGMLYSVFQELDEFDSGRLTYSAFEQAACKIGMRPAQAKRLFEHLDPQSRGFATMREWSSPHLQRQMEAFTRLYVQATRGADGRPKDITEVRSMHMAIQMAMTKLQLRRSGRAVSLDRLVQAFAYMDRDSNGALNAEEVEDALNSLGIFVTKEVVDTIMRTFDKDGNGCVDYYEFCKSLYPTLDSSVYHH